MCSFEVLQCSVDESSMGYSLGGWEWLMDWEGGGRRRGGERGGRSGHLAFSWSVSAFRGRLSRVRVTRRTCSLVITSAMCLAKALAISLLPGPGSRFQSRKPLKRINWYCRYQIVSLQVFRQCLIPWKNVVLSRAKEMIFFSSSEAEFRLAALNLILLETLEGRGWLAHGQTTRNARIMLRYPARKHSELPSKLLLHYEIVPFVLFAIVPGSSYARIHS